MSIEEKVRAYKELRRKIEEMEEQKKALVTEILQLMPKETKTLLVAEYSVKRVARLSIKTSLDDARPFGAVKMAEVIDRERIKQLHAQGHSIPNVSEFQFIQVTLLEPKVEAEAEKVGV